MKFMDRPFTGVYGSYRRVKTSKRLPKAKPTVRAFSSTINNGSNMENLVREGKLLWESFGGEKTYAKSFWIGRDETPRCHLENFAQECAKFHYPNYVGAEYWLQIRESIGESEGLEFHFDKDEEELKHHDRWKHPVYSTVTYLNYHQNSSSSTFAQSRIWGAPLVVFNTTSAETPERLIPLPPVELVDGQPLPAQVPGEAWVVLPVPGSHVVFEGNLLHGVPSELNALLYGAGAGGKGMVPMRMALAVNVWSKKPLNLVRLKEGHVTTTTTGTSDLQLDQPYFASATPCELASVTMPHLPRQPPGADTEAESDDSATADSGPGADHDCCGGRAKALPPGGLTSRCGRRHILSEHLEGHTSHLPLQAIREQYMRSVAETTPTCSGLHIRYKRR